LGHIGLRDRPTSREICRNGQKGEKFPHPCNIADGA
jgi:hypothetical protein